MFSCSCFANLLLVSWLDIGLTRFIVIILILLKTVDKDANNIYINAITSNTRHLVEVKSAVSVLFWCIQMVNVDFFF